MNEEHRKQIPPKKPLEKGLVAHIKEGLLTTGKWTRRFIYTGIVGGVVGGLAYTGTYSVSESENALVLRLGDAHRTVTLANEGKPMEKSFMNLKWGGEYKLVLENDGPGLHFKIPFIETVEYSTNKVLLWDEDPEKMQTARREVVHVDSYAYLTIKDPENYREKLLGNMERFQKQSNATIRPAVKDQLTQRTLREIVSNTPPSTSPNDSPDEYSASPTYVGREEIMERIKNTIKAPLSSKGIDIRTILIKRADLPEESDYSILSNMEAERIAVKDRIISEGYEEANKINGQREKEKLEIISGAKLEAETIRADAAKYDAQTRYSAYASDPRLFCIMVVPELIGEGMKDRTTSIMSLEQVRQLVTDNNCQAYLKPPTEKSQ